MWINCVRGTTSFKERISLLTSVCMCVCMREKEVCVSEWGGERETDRQTNSERLKERQREDEPKKERKKERKTHR